MFTGIVKSLGTLTARTPEGSNVHLRIRSELSSSLSVDQSVAHDGVCLTVTEVDGDEHVVTAVRETLDRSALGDWQPGRRVNLELAMLAGARLDGHIVQGHVDAVGEVVHRADLDGSWSFRFRYRPSAEHMVVDKGSVCVNGVSLTVVDPADDTFGVAIIPYTYEHTSFRELRVGDRVNLEFDVIGKYVAKWVSVYGPAALQPSASD